MSEGKVIKFNLMGAIGVLILIITAITGLIIGVKKIKDNKENSVPEQQIQENEMKHNEEEDSKKLNLQIEKNGSGETVVLTKFKSLLGYSIYYDESLFYLNENKNENEIVDSFECLYSDSIVFNISKINVNYRNKVQELSINSENDNNENSQSQNVYKKAGQIYVGNCIAIEEIIADNNLYTATYIIENTKDTNSCFYIEIKCERQFEDSVIPTILEMLKTFEV